MREQEEKKPNISHPSPEGYQATFQTPSYVYTNGTAFFQQTYDTYSGLQNLSNNQNNLHCITITSGLYWTFSKSGLSGNRTFFFPDTGLLKLLKKSKKEILLFNNVKISNSRFSPVRQNLFSKFGCLVLSGHKPSPVEP